MRIGAIRRVVDRPCTPVRSLPRLLAYGEVAGRRSSTRTATCRSAVICPLRRDRTRRPRLRSARRGCWSSFRRRTHRPATGSPRPARPASRAGTCRRRTDASSGSTHLLWSGATGTPAARPDGRSADRSANGSRSRSDVSRILGSEAARTLRAATQNWQPRRL